MKTFLFQGDSITDAGRSRENDILRGFGYPTLVSAELLLDRPGEFNFINRGISGNRVVDLYARIKKDFINLKPDYLSILIGVNDVWHEIARKNGVELDRFENIYRTLLKDTKAALPGVKLILCEPFVLRGSATDENYDKFLQVKEYAKVVKKLSVEFGTEFVALQDKYDELGAKYGNEKLLGDGVHPTLYGGAVLAKEWLKAFDRLNK